MTDQPETGLLVPRDAAPVARVDPTANDILMRAVEQGVDVEALEKLVALSERVEDRKAAREFNDALARFQQDCPAITKNRTSGQVSDAGSGRRIPYADLDHITRTIRPTAHANGLSWSWDSEDMDGKHERVTCSLRHVGGHVQRSTCTIPTESRAGMSAQQKVGSANAYGMRYTLIMAMGLTSCDEDTDGADPAEREPISPEQVGSLEDKIRETGSDREAFLEYMGVEKIGDITQGSYRRALAAFAAKARQGKR